MDFEQGGYENTREVFLVFFQADLLDPPTGRLFGGKRRVKETLVENERGRINIFLDS